MGANLRPCSPYDLCTGSGIAHDGRFCWCLKGRWLSQAYALSSVREQEWSRVKATWVKPPRSSEPQTIGDVLKGLNA